MVGPEDPFPVGEQLGEQVAGTDGIASASRPGRERVTGGEGVGMVGPEDPFHVGEQLGAQVAAAWRDRQRFPSRTRGCCGW